MFLARGNGAHKNADRISQIPNPIRRSPPIFWMIPAYRSTRSSGIELRITVRMTKGVRTPAENAGIMKSGVIVVLIKIVSIRIRNGAMAHGANRMAKSDTEKKNSGKGREPGYQPRCPPVHPIGEGEETQLEQPCKDRDKAGGSIDEQP